MPFQETIKVPQLLRPSKSQLQTALKVLPSAYPANFEPTSGCQDTSIEFCVDSGLVVLGITESESPQWPNGYYVQAVNP